MLNQLIAVSGTIAVAIIGFIALIVSNAKSNRNMLELEKFKHETQETDRVREHHRALLEELASLIYGAHLAIAASLIGQNRSTNTDYLKPAESLNRIGVIVVLYYKDFTQVNGKFHESYAKLDGLHREVNELLKTRTLQDPKVQKLVNQLTQQSEEFGVASAAFLSKIRDLSEKMF
jgi:hypothetical protein